MLAQMQVLPCSPLGRIEHHLINAQRHDHHLWFMGTHDQHHVQQRDMIVGAVLDIYGVDALLTE